MISSYNVECVDNSLHRRNTSGGYEGEEVKSFDATFQTPKGTFSKFHRLYFEEFHFATHVITYYETDIKTEFVEAHYGYRRAM